VKSFAKFWQMIGRGTRLCPDIFSIGEDKEHFLIFDTCSNFEFFEAQVNQAPDKVSKPITQQIFESRVHLSRLLIEDKGEGDLELAAKLLNILHESISTLDMERFQVKMKRKYVDEFSKRERWSSLNVDDVHLLEEHLSFLPVAEVVNEMARRFDLMMLKMQIANLMLSRNKKKFENNLITIAEGLSQKYTIPDVARSKGLIESLKNPDFYKGVSQKKLDEIREEIREIIHYLDIASRPSIYTNIQDSEVTMVANEPDFTSNYGLPYKKRVESFIRENRFHLTISKLSSNTPITLDELNALEAILFDGSDRGTKEDFVKEFGDEPLGVFIRSIVGLDAKAAQDAFSDFLKAGSLKADQMTFIQTIIAHLTKNGTIDPSMLFESPFTDMNDQGLMGVFDDASSHKIISIVERINENALVVG
jgi:type I restriction enzyme R subunit